MKTILKQFLKYYLKFFTRLTLMVKRPVIIAIAGSTNKTFTRDEIIARLSAQNLPVRTNPKSFNTEIGLPLSILNLESGYNEYSQWIPTLLAAPLSIFKKDFPKYLVLELGISSPGDMKYLLSLINPDIAVITDITQRYVDSFAGMDRLVDEYEYLSKKTKKDGLLILNKDNYRINSLAKSSRTRVCKFGINKNADWQATLVEKTKSGQSLKILHNKESKRYAIPRHGSHHVYALLAGLIIEDYVISHNK